jgi:FPC/CPF motif-containing protein YcgG
MLATRFLAVNITVLSSAGPNSARASTVHDLVTYCSSSIDSSDYSYCVGVMVGPEDLAKVATFNELRQQSQKIHFLFLTILKRANRSQTHV